MAEHPVGHADLLGGSGHHVADDNENNGVAVGGGLGEGAHEEDGHKPKDDSEDLHGGGEGHDSAPMMDVARWKTPPEACWSSSESTTRGRSSSNASTGRFQRA